MLWMTVPKTSSLWVTRRVRSFFPLCKNTLLVVENKILISHCWKTPGIRAVYESMDVPAGQPADNPPNPEGLGVYHQTVFELKVQVHWPPGKPFWQRFGLDPDPDPKRWSGTFATSIRVIPITVGCQWQRRISAIRDWVWVLTMVSFLWLKFSGCFDQPIIDPLSVFLKSIEFVYILNCCTPRQPLDLTNSRTWYYFRVWYKAVLEVLLQKVYLNSNTMIDAYS